MGDFAKQLGAATNSSYWDQAAGTSGGSNPQLAAALAAASGGDSLAPLTQADPMQGVSSAMPDFASSQGGGQMMGQDQSGLSNLGQLFANPTQPNWQGAAPAAANQIDNPYTPDDPSDVTKSVANIGTPDDDGMSVKSFKPHEVHGFLGHLADFFLAGALSRGKDDQNMKEATQGFTQDPEETIRKIATFNPELALRLQGKYVDDQRQQGTLERQNAVTDMAVDKYVRTNIGDMVQGTMGQVDPKKYAEIWPQVRARALAFAEKRKVDLSDELPADYNDVDVNAIRMGGVSVPKQIQLTNQTKNTDSQITHRATQDKQGEEKIGIQKEDVHSKITRREAETAQGQTKTDLQGQKYADKQPKVVNTKYGPGIVKGNQMIVHAGGMMHAYVTNDGTHWTHVSSVPEKK